MQIKLQTHVQISTYLTLLTNDRWYEIDFNKTHLPTSDFKQFYTGFCSYFFHYMYLIL